MHGLMRLVLAPVVLAAMPLHAQIRVHPTGVNVNTQGATTAFLSFGGLRSQVAVEAFWCGELVPAAPGRGFRCDPSTIFGRLPLRYERGSTSAGGAFTDIMAIPPSVSRRAYQEAVRGKKSSFFYVRRFVSTIGAPDEFVAVTCRLAGGGARVPFSLTNVTVSFDVEAPVLFVAPGEPLPSMAADIAYNGTGRLRGRWEVVLPGEEVPAVTDLLTEATLPPEERGTQRRYTQVQRFNVFLPPTGRVSLPGPDMSRLPTNAEGAYMILLRIEATDDKEGDSDLGASGAAAGGVLHNGAVAGFPMPTLRYVVGGGSSALSPTSSRRALRLLLPREGAAVAADSSLHVSWLEEWNAALYRVDIESEDGTHLLSAMIPPGLGAYQVPPYVLQRAAGTTVRWRMQAFDFAGSAMRRSAWRTVRVGAAPNASSSPGP